MAQVRVGAARQPGEGWGKVRVITRVEAKVRVVLELVRARSPPSLTLTLNPNPKP